MPRGSSSNGGRPPAFASVEILQSGGQVDNSGKYTVSRKYYVTDENDLITTPVSYSAGGKTMYPSALSYQKIAGGVWEKTIEFTAGVGSSDTGVVTKLEQTGTEEGRLQLEVTAELAPIEQHPEIDELIKKYNGFTEKGKVLFPKTYSGQGTGTSGGGSQPNPFFGMRYYYSPSATLRHTYNVNSMPGDLFGEVFKIVPTSSLPGNLPNLADYGNRAGVTLKYFWQIQMPQVSITGGRIEITDTYTLMKPMTAEAAEDMNRIANISAN